MTCTSAKALTLHAQGAAQVVATQEQDVLKEAKRITGGKGRQGRVRSRGPRFVQLVEAAATSGSLVIYGALGGATATFPILPLRGRNLSIHGFGLTATRLDDTKLEALKTFIGSGLASGDLKPVIDKTFPFAEIVNAHHYLEAGEQICKTVVTI